MIRDNDFYWKDNKWEIKIIASEISLQIRDIRKFSYII